MRTLSLVQSLNTDGATVRKRIEFRNDHRAVYLEHVIDGLQGRFPCGVQTILALPENQTLHLAAAPFATGSTPPLHWADPSGGHYAQLCGEREFDSLEAVPRAAGASIDVARLPSTPGYDDLIMLNQTQSGLTWTAVTLDGYVFFHLKDAGVLPQTLCWFSNGGRWSEPWQGRHRNRLGIAEACTYFDAGTRSSRRNPLQRAGHATTMRFSRRVPTTIRLIQGAHPVPRDFGKVAQITPQGPGAEVVITSESGSRVTVPIDWSWVLEASGETE